MAWHLLQHNGIRVPIEQWLGKESASGWNLTNSLRAAKLMDFNV